MTIGSDPCAGAFAPGRYGSGPLGVRWGSLLASLLLNSALAVVAAVAFGPSNLSGHGRPEALVTVTLREQAPSKRLPAAIEQISEKGAKAKPQIARPQSETATQPAQPLSMSPASVPPTPVAVIPSASERQDANAHEPDLALAPVPSEADVKAKDSYRDRVWRRILAVRPSGATVRGRAVVRFRITRGGAIVMTEIAQSSGQFILDRLALQAVRRAGPFPAPPETLSDAELTFTVPLDFHG